VSGANGGDHIKPASTLGPTDLANGQMINGADNQTKGNSTPEDD
jgi:hypothetical protein